MRNFHFTCESKYFDHTIFIQTAYTSNTETDPHLSNHLTKPETDHIKARKRDRTEIKKTGKTKLISWSCPTCQ